MLAIFKIEIIILVILFVKKRFLFFEDELFHRPGRYDEGLTFTIKVRRLRLGLFLLKVGIEARGVNCNRLVAPKPFFHPP